MKNLLLLIFCLSYTFSYAQEDKKEEAIEFGKKVTIHSKILDEDRSLMLYVPQGTADETFPVLYLLDARGHYLSVASMVQQLSVVNGNSTLPKMIIVGISNTNRTRDLTPTKGDASHPMVEAAMVKASGGGDQFISFMEKELFPYIEKNYPTRAHRTFVGHSLGGLMVMHTWLKYTDLFNAYIAIDPSLWWSNSQLAKEIMSTLIDEKFANVALYHGFANSEGKEVDLKALKKDDSPLVEHMRKNLEVFEYLQKNSGKNLKFAGKYYANDNHGSVPLISEYDGLRFIFDFHTLNLGPADLFDEQVDLAGKIEAHYKVLSEKFEEPIRPQEFLINSWGYEMLKREFFKKAEALFKLNVSYFPKSYNVYDSLADYYMAVGEEEKAKENFKKSISIYPNSPSKQKLYKLENEGAEMELTKIEVDPSILSTYAGKYEIAPNFILTISNKGSQLYAQATGQSQNSLSARSNTEFYLGNDVAQIVFQVKEGKVESLTLYQNGQEVKCKRLK